MNHAEAHSHLPDYLEGDLDLTRRALLDAHLDGCPACSREFAEMRGTIDLLRSLPNPEPPPFLVEAVMRRIRQGEGHRGFADRLRDWLAELATPQVALPATALTVGLLMASGVFDPASVPLPGFGSGARTPTVQVHVVPQSTRNGALEDRLADLTARGYGSLRDTRVPVSLFAAPPPAVAGAPGVTITVPAPPIAIRQGVTMTQLASDDPTSARGSRWTRSIRNPGQPYANSGFLMNASNLVRNAGTLVPSPFSPDAVDSEAERAQRLASDLDRRLDQMARQPVVFASDFDSLATVEQQIWLEALADRARESGRGDQVLQELRMSGDRLALKVAAAFAAELRRAEVRTRPEMASAVDQGSSAEPR